LHIAIHADMPQFFLYCQTDGRCVLKQQGEQATRQFADILEAVTFISNSDVDRTSTLTVYDPAGRVMSQDLLSARNRRLSGLRVRTGPTLDT